MYLHPEILEILSNTDPDIFDLNFSSVRNAERVLNYIEDINLERTGRFEVTPDESLYMLWEVENWDFHIECLKNGRMRYTFRKNGYGKIYGSTGLEEFILLLEWYLLMEFR
ncbi:MAG TPA: hypothetical protein VGI43_13945 [Mucilaginibacter sp.]